MPVGSGSSSGRGAARIAAIRAVVIGAGVAALWSSMASGQNAPPTHPALPGTPARPDTPGAPADAQHAARVEALSWLAGTWRVEHEGAIIEEHWSTPEGGVMLGQSKTIRGGKAVFLEWAKIEPRDGGVVYTVRPSAGDRAAEFKAVEAGPQRLVIVNENNDMPRTIRYEQTLLGTVKVTLEGTQRGVPAREEYEMRRTPAR